MNAISDIYPLLNQPRKVVITMHQKPDGDAMGSTLGLCHFLTQFGHEVQVISPTNWTSFLDWMPGVKQVLDFDANQEKCKGIIHEAQWLFCLDFNTLSRTKNMEQVLAAAPGQRILIDHHQQPQTEVFTYGLSDTGKSSTCEMVYDFIINSGFSEKLNLDIARCLYTGVMTDTGSFRFPATTASVHRMIATLKDLGMNHSPIHEDIYDNFLESRFRFIGNVLLNRLEIFYEYNTALIAVPHSDLLQFDIKTGDTEGLVNYPLGIQGIKLAAIIIDRGEERKMSFRSKGGFDVNEFARKYFNGGGHKNASGGGDKVKSLNQVVEEFKKAMEANRDQLSTYNF